MNKSTRTQNGPKPTTDGERLALFESKNPENRTRLRNECVKALRASFVPAHDSALAAYGSNPGRPGPFPYLFLRHPLWNRHHR